MESITLITALLCTFSWMSVSVCEFYTVEVQPGDEVRLICSNFTSRPLNVNWFRLNWASNVSQISRMVSSEMNASFYDDFQDGRFEMKSNSTHIFLKIKPVYFNDSGLYFCGFNCDSNPVIVSAAYLNVHEVSFGISYQINMILCALIVCLSIIFTAAVLIIRKHYSAPKEDENQQNKESQNLCPDDLNYAALRFNPEATSGRRPATEDEPQTHAVYAATR